MATTFKMQALYTFLKMRGKTRIWLWVVISILLPPILALLIQYHAYRQTPSDQPPFFDLFIADKFFEPDTRVFLDPVSKDVQRPVEWLIDPKNETLDSLALTLKNTSGEKFYYTSWGGPFTHYGDDLIVYKDGQADTIPFDGHGCGTGVYLAPFGDGEIMTKTILNPLLFYLNYYFSPESDSFLNNAKDRYGDSVAIVLGQPTYGLPWKKYPSQLIHSEQIIISTDQILDNWKQGKYARLQNTESPVEE